MPLTASVSTAYRPGGVSSLTAASLAQQAAAQQAAAQQHQPIPVRASIQAPSSGLPFGLTPLTAAMVVAAIGLGGYALYEAFK